MARKHYRPVPIRICRDPRVAGPLSDQYKENLQFFVEFSEFSSEPAEAGERARSLLHYWRE